jgi:hypothetical protein
MVVCFALFKEREKENEMRMDREKIYKDRWSVAVSRGFTLFACGGIKASGVRPTEKTPPL